MQKFPEIFIVILNYNGQSFLLKCLASVFKNDYPNFEVVVVDNNSKDGSFEAAKKSFSKAHFIRNEENIGFAAGNNIGIRFALERMADYVLLLNNDTEVEKDFLRKLTETGEKNKEAGILSPIIFNGNNKKVWFSGGKINWLKMKAVHENSIRTEDTYGTEFVSGCAMLIKKEVFKKIGLLDEDFFLYWEDVDFSIRAKRAGHKNMVVSGSWVYHFEKSAQNIKNKTYWLVVSGLIFFRKNTPAMLRLWIAAYILIRNIKNKLDLIFRRNELAPTVQKAYQDFKKLKKES